MGISDIFRKPRHGEPFPQADAGAEVDVEVAGESHHTDALERIFRAADRPWGGVIMRTATLVPEPENPYDDTAVAVYIEGMRVGYVPRDDQATKYRAITASEKGKRPTVLARVWARDDNGVWVARVTLSFSGETESEWSYETDSREMYPADDSRDVEVISESHHREAFAEIFGRAGWPLGGVVMRMAALIPDPQNPYGNDEVGLAVAVYVEGLIVGYVPHGDLSTKKRAYDAHAAGRHFTVPARIWSRNDDGVWRARVTLSFSGSTEPERPYT